MCRIVSSRLRYASLFLCCLGFNAVAWAPGHARDTSWPPDARSEPNWEGSKRPVGEGDAPNTNTWVIFGLGEGSDTGKQGERTIYYESLLGIPKLAKRPSNWTSNWGAAYSLTDQSVIWLGGQSSFLRAMDNSTLWIDGFGPQLGFKHQFVTRDEVGVGVAVSASGFWQRFQDAGMAYDTVGGELRLMTDWALEPNLAFAALNLSYQPQQSMQANHRQAVFELSLSVAGRVEEKTFIGAEIRQVNYARSLSPAGIVESAVYLGPTLSFTLGENGYLGAAWSIRATNPSERSNTALDRHQLRVKAGFSF